MHSQPQIPSEAQLWKRAPPFPSLEQRSGPALNVLKHGGHAETLLFAGEALAEFRRHRRAAFHRYRPQTEDEEGLVEAMVEHRWRPVETRFDAQATYPDAVRVCEPSTHQRLDSRVDVTSIAPGSSATRTAPRRA